MDGPGKMKKTITLLCLVFCIPWEYALGQEITLFNGENLDGWTIYGTERWYVEDGELICESGPDEDYGYLGTDQIFKNFDLSVDFKQEANGNSGIFFRSSIEGTIITGWQVEVAPPGNDSGGIYESYGRGWLIQPDSLKDDVLRMGDWNTMRIRVVGDRVKTWLNGVLMVELEDQKIGQATGSIALQIHDGGGIKVRWKNLLLTPLPAFDLEEQSLYRTTLVRAAPGRLQDLITFLADETMKRGSMIARHSQGDDWDLIQITPLPDANSPSLNALTQSDLFHELIAHQEDLFVFGPPPEEVRPRFEQAGLFHIEMFKALPGHRQALLEQRIMENDYYRALNKPGNMIFTRAMGSAWDLFTLGFYENMVAFAANSEVDALTEDQAAQTAGFADASAIGLYLRSLIAYHNDTLAVPIE